ncbi:unnamed protein product [Arctogadus glacialis]
MGAPTSKHVCTTWSGGAKVHSLLPAAVYRAAEWRAEENKTASSSELHSAGRSEASCGGRCAQRVKPQGEYKRKVDQNALEDLCVLSENGADGKEEKDLPAVLEKRTEGTTVPFELKFDRALDTCHI